MTNRRRSGKGRTSVSKKTESPEKQPRKLTRRSKRSKKSESPERPEELDSDYSGDEQAEDGDIRKFDREDETVLEPLKNDDQKSQVKEEESGGSDGSWKVKSENGGGGGIPKLKLCLTRPPEMSSPTSVEQHPSPRRRRRGARGNITPTKEEDQTEGNIEEYPKRITRNQKAKIMSEAEVVSEEKQDATSTSEPVLSVAEPEQETVLSKSKPESENQNESICAPQNQPASDTINKVEPEAIYNSRHNEEDETRLAVESICVMHPSGVNDSSDPADGTRSEKVTEEVQLPAENIEVYETHLTEKEQDEKAKEKKLKPLLDEIKEPQGQTKPETTLGPQCEVEPVASLEPESEPEPKSKPEPSPESQAVSISEKRRSSSRDSSEERAKEAALRSRNKNRKKETPLSREVNETLRSNISEKSGSNGMTEKKSTSISVSGKTIPENAEESNQPKSGNARKRRWGSSTNINNKKQSVSISTDFLKEIIPEAKPLLMSEVQLSPNEEDEEGQLKGSEENLTFSAKKHEKEKLIQSDESEKDYEEEVTESALDETTQSETLKPIPPVKEKEFSTSFTRKVLSSNERLQKSPSPPKHKPSNIIYIVNLVRPFTIPQLRELLARTGTIVEDGFWIDKIKSKCYVKYETEEEAKTTRHALHGVRWPVSNPKQLLVDFGTEAAMKAAIEGNEIVTKRSIPSLFDKQIDLKAREHSRDRDKDRVLDKRDRNEKDRKDRAKSRDNEKREEDDKEKKSRPPVEPPPRDKTVRRVTMPVREWDVGKNEDGFSPPPEGVEFSRHRDDRYERRVEYDRNRRDDYDDRRRREKERNRRSMSEEPPRKSKKKNEEETPAKLLDDLFRKTKATPCIYWLPLTPEQISVKEEMRRKHMAEHEKKVAELRKLQREQNKRSADKRRRRTKSRSPSKSIKK